MCLLVQYDLGSTTIKFCLKYDIFCKLPFAPKMKMLLTLLPEAECAESEGSLFLSAQLL